VAIASKAGAFVLLAALAHAPLQCAHEVKPELRTEDDPAEELYLLAEQFRLKGEPAARRETLERLQARYPNSRFAVRAREDLGQPVDPAPSASR
jgi:hypothetical protein